MKRIYLIIPLVLVIFITIGFSAHETNLLVDNIGVVVRAYKLVRVTNVENPITNNGASFESYDYNVNSINSKVKLPNINSSITYSVTITNIGTQDIGILDMILSNNNLDYDIDGVKKIEKVCNTNNVCNSGISRTYSVKIKYKSGATVTNDDINFIATFNFKNYYTITYSGFDSTTGLDTGILQDDTKTITFTTTTGIPENITVTGATGNYVNPATTTPEETATLELSNATGNVTLTAVTQAAPDMAYTTLINIYDNSVPSEDNSCNNSLLYDNTSDLNLRFVGSNPCNYVYFNCSDPDNPTSSTCEKWRIIGVFNKNNHQVLKIINSTFYNNGGNVQFNSTNNRSFVLWGTNTLSTTFNTTYYNNMAHNDNHDFIETVNWPIGATTNLGVKPDVLYTAENASVTSNQLSFGLLTVTDINYGTSVISCYNTLVNKWDSDCMEKASYNWLYEGTEYTLTPYSVTNYYVYKMQTNYQPYRASINSDLPARVVTYLKNNVYFEDGNGSINSPYILKLYN